MQNIQSTVSKLTRKKSKTWIKRSEVIPPQGRYTDGK